MTRATGTLLVCVLGLSISEAFAQGIGQTVPSTAECVALNQTVLRQAVNGQLTEVEAAIGGALSSGTDDGQVSCVGLVLANLASLMITAGQPGEAEAFAERSVNILEKVYSPDDSTLLRPLQMLATARFEQGKIARAREAFKRMHLIRVERPEDKAFVYGIAASLLQEEGRRKEAESQFLAALQACVAAKQGETTFTASILNSLASLYIEERRLDEAHQMLDRALTIFNHAPDAVPMDRVKVLQLRGLLHARGGEWKEAAQDFYDALLLADRELRVDPVIIRSLLVGYAFALRKDHRRQDARVIEARLAALGPDRGKDNVVDVTDLFAKSKHK